MTKFHGRKKNESSSVRRVLNKNEKEKDKVRDRKVEREF